MSKQQKLIDEGEIAADYLEQFLDIIDFDGDIDLDVEGDRALALTAATASICLSAAMGKYLKQFRRLLA